MSRTQQALKLIEQGLSPYHAAKKLKLAESVVYRALHKSRENKPRCPTCGQIVRK